MTFTGNCILIIGLFLCFSFCQTTDLEEVVAVKCTVYLADLEDYAEMNKAYSAFFPENPPARACVQVAGLVREAKVEISMIAAK